MLGIRRVAAVCAAAVLMLSLAGPVSAVAPNDELAGAIPIALNQTVHVDTTDATTGAADPTTCITPDGWTIEGPFSNSAWWKVQPVSDETLTFWNDYMTNSMVWVFDGDLDHEVACGFSPTWSASAGSTYYLMIATWGAGGLLGDFAIDEPLPTVSVAVGTGVRLDKTGSVTITGTVSCSNPNGNGSISIELRQPVGRKFTVIGSGATSWSCSTTPAKWTVVVQPLSGKFAGGTATGTVQTDVWNREQQNWTTENLSIRLRGGR